MEPIAPAEFTVNAPADRVWIALLAAYADMNYPPASMDRAGWFVTSAESKIPDGQEVANADCGRWMGSDRTPLVDVFVRLSTTLRAAGDSTAVRIQAQLRGMDPSAARDPTIFANDVGVTCVSKGTVERRLADAIRNRLQ